MGTREWWGGGGQGTGNIRETWSLPLFPRVPRQPGAAGTVPSALSPFGSCCRTDSRPAPPGQGEGFSLHWALPDSVPCDCSRQVPNPVLVLGTESHPLFGGLGPLHLFPGVGVQSLWKTWPTLLSWQGTRPAALTSRVGIALGLPPAQGIPSPAPRWAQTPSPGKPRPGRARG